MDPKNISNQDKTDKLVVIPDPGQALRPLHKQTKLTRKKKIEFLTHLGKEYNISRAATKIGVHRKAIQYLINNDPQFKQAVQEVKDAYLDEAENSGFKLAIQPTREGFNDRKLLLQAHRPDVYNPVQKSEVQFTIKEDNATMEARKMLANLAVKTADYKVIG